MMRRTLNSFPFPLLQPLTFGFLGQNCLLSCLYPSGSRIQTGESIFHNKPPYHARPFFVLTFLAITSGQEGVVVWFMAKVDYGYWWEGEAGATNLTLAPKAVSGALGALKRQLARSPWIGGQIRLRHTHTYTYAKQQTEKIFTALWQILTSADTHTSTGKLLCLLSLSLSYTHRPSLATNAINILEEGIEASLFT